MVYSSLLEVLSEKARCTMFFAGKISLTVYEVLNLFNLIYIIFVGKLHSVHVYFEYKFYKQVIIIKLFKET